MNRPIQRLRVCRAAALAGAALALLFSTGCGPDKPEAGADVAKIERALDEIRGRLPGQSHTMADVAYHFNGLWFAGQERNWPLAEFLLAETKSHLRWSVRVRPVRPLSGGGEFHVGDMLAGIEQGTLKELEESVRAKDLPRFTTAYKQQLGSCYACHVAAEKPYLRLHIPERPAETMLEFDPAGPDRETP